MRLIDADELLKGRSDHEMISTHLIFNAPTVDVLDKISTEIGELIEWHDCPIELDNGCDACYREACNTAIQIIDKYR